MKITNCKLSKKAQKKLLGYFVPEVTARSAADVLSIQLYDVLDVSGFHHYRINHSKTFAQRQNHINGIGNFWNQAKHVLSKYNGIDRKSFPLFLKECGFRFNFGTPSKQLKILRDWYGI